MKGICLAIILFTLYVMVSLRLNLFIFIFMQCDSCYSTPQAVCAGTVIFLQLCPV